MEEKFMYFLQAAQELDDLSLEGYFGLETQKLVEQRDNTGVTDYLIQCLDEWIEDIRQYGKERVKQLMIVFLDMYAESVRKEGQKSVDILAAFWKGTPDNPEIECFSSYSELIRLHTENTLIMHEMQKKSVQTMADKKRLASSLINTYSKGLEFIGKVLTTCIILRKIALDEEYEMMKIYHMTLYEKIKLFTKLSKGKYHDLVSFIHRNIRNADAHLNIRYNPSENNFLFKTKSGKKVKVEKIRIEKMILEVYPQVGWFVQAFVYSGILLTLVFTDKAKFNEKVKQVFFEK